ncbi:MAG TPA: T9SS type A sorting domain-containing protein [Saprospiraceae bacterium]|nr:T9SS type A sorting domain-containing protein [Saprospiraceae bacterium]HMQ84598.1 T9SS type A sorting domain-containing protein [Saprospiraceae bacterium]
MKWSLICIIVSVWSFAAQAQQWDFPCGAPSGKSAWLKQYQLNPQAHSRSTDTLLLVPLTIHIVGTDGGEGYFGVKNLLDALCTLNADYEPANIQFFIEGDIRYINNSSYYNHATVLEGAAMMFENNVPNTINTYFVADPAGNCGYNLPYAGIAMRKSCSDATDHTWAHEVGHNLSLPHPFLGWEGGVSYDGSIPHNFNDPAPEVVLYDYTYFQDTLIMDTLIIDTAYVEKVDGSNCHFAADGFCDTHPDYLANRWNCNANSMSTTQQTDPNGEHFFSEGWWIMSYSDDACANSFSSEQIVAMRANLYEEKPEYLYNQTLGELVAAAPAILEFPAAGELVQFDEVALSWQPVEGATHYLLQISRLNNFTAALTNDYLLTDNQTTVFDLENERSYYWRVRAFNAYSFCTAFSAVEEFETSDVSATDALDNIHSIQVFPNPLAAGSSMTLVFDLPASLDVQAALFNSCGQLIEQQSFSLAPGIQRRTFNTPTLSTGVYCLKISSKQGLSVRRVVVGG